MPTALTSCYLTKRITKSLYIKIHLLFFALFLALQTLFRFRSVFFSSIYFIPPRSLPTPNPTAMCMYI